MSKSKLDTIDIMLEMVSIGHPYSEDTRLRRRLQAQRDMLKVIESISALLYEIVFMEVPSYA